MIDVTSFQRSLELLVLVIGCAMIAPLAITMFGEFQRARAEAALQKYRWRISRR
jgi:hypothetical protein